MKLAHLGKLSYDQTHATNGYHPVWRLLVGALFALGRLLHLPELSEIYLVLLASTALLGGGVWLLGRAMERDGRLSPLFALLPLGAYGILAAPWLWREAANNPAFGFPLYGSLWNNVDGMETCATTFAFCLAAWLYVRDQGRERLRDGALLGAALALLTLSRLDHIFFAGMLLVGVAAHDLLGAQRASRHFLGALVAFVAPVALYLVLNKLIVGTALPVSGMLKSTFPHPSLTNWHRIATTLKAPLATSTWRMYRLAQLVLPVPFVLLPLLSLFRRRDRFDELLLLCAPAVLALFAYDFLFVDLVAHGHWYFPVSTLFMSLAVLRAVGERPRAVPWARVIVAACAALCVVAFVELNGRLGYGAAYADFYFDVAPKVREFSRRAAAHRPVSSRTTTASSPSPRISPACRGAASTSTRRRSPPIEAIGC